MGDVHFAVMAVPPRLPWVKRNILPHLPIATEVFVDRYRRGVWWNARRAWTSYQHLPRPVSHVCVVQDDVVLAPDFAGAVMRIVDILVDEVVCFFGMSQAIGEAFEQGKAWAVLFGAVAAPAVLFPVPLLEEFLAWEVRYVSQEWTTADDMRMALFLMLKGKWTWFTAPCLVDHVGRKSAIPGRSWLGRRAAVFVPDRSALSYPWENIQDVVRKRLYTLRGLVRRYGLERYLRPGWDTFFEEESHV